MMKRNMRGAMAAMVLAAVATAAASAAPADDAAMEQGFHNPPPTARPHTWWHWMDGNVTKEGITADLEAMARVGIGGAQIFDVAMGVPSGPVEFNSPQWRALVKHAAVEAKRLGLELCVNNCAGWANAGGPWNKPEQGMQTVVRSERKVRGPMNFDETLPQPLTRLNCYDDIAVVAFRTPPAEAFLMSDVKPTITTSAAGEDVQVLTDGRNDTFVRFAIPTPQTPQTITLQFPQPFTARKLTITPGGEQESWRGQLEVSEDGVNYRKLASIAISNEGDRQVFTFDRVTARYYRIVMQSSTSMVNRLWIAEVELTPMTGIRDFEGKAFYVRGADRPAAWPAVAAEEVVKAAEIVDLTAKMDKTGRLTWSVPPGDWTIVRLGYTPVGKTNHPARESGRGLECDKLSVEGAQSQWEGMVGKLISELGPLAGTSFNNVVVDSYEVGSQNWTRGFEKEFRARRGYDMRPYLPALSGRVVENQEVTERFLWDFRRTVADLFAEKFSATFSALAHKNGMLYSVEPYGNGPTDDLQYGRYADIPMAEFWVSGAALQTIKSAASVAHVYGQKYVGAESFTASPEDGKWLGDPYSLKKIGDLAWTKGVNRYIFHRYAHQPWTNPTRWPGMTMGPWGSHFERTLTWWEPGKAWITYQMRAQFLLQSGRFVGDVLFCAGENAPNGGGRDGNLPSGYDYDVCSAETLLKDITVKDGRLVAPSGASYALLVLPNNPAMTPAMVRRVAELAKAGATIVGPRPTRSPSLAGYPQCDDEVKRLAAELWPSVVKEISVTEAIVAKGLAPDFACDSRAQIEYIHRRTEGADIYFLSNQKLQGQEVECTFRVSGRQPELWRADTGAIEDAPVFRQKDGVTTVPLRFDPAGSVFVVFRRPANADPLVAFQATLEKRAEAPQPKLEILQARYGVFGSPMSVDLTAAIREQVQRGDLRVAASNVMAGGDPAPSQEKELRIEFTLRGQPQPLLRIPENKETTLPEGADVVSATYGVAEASGPSAATPPPLPPKQMDVTAAVRSKVEAGNLQFMVTNEISGGKDPAQNEIKSLRVEYTVKGEPKCQTVPEGKMMTLPKDATIVAAIFGKVSLERVDVTDKVAALVRSGATEIPVTNDLSGVDPALNENKVLRVEYTLQGQKKRAVAAEGRKMAIPKGATIVSATYGKAFVGGQADVTEQVAAMVQSGVRTIRVTNELAGGDPALGEYKDLRIEFLSKGIKRSRLAAEGQAITLPPDAKVVSAVYGKILTGKLFDVTDQIAAKVEEDSLYIQVGNELAGRDPSLGEAKVLRLTYRYNGEEKTVVASEGSWVALPESKPVTPWPFELSAQPGGKIDLYVEQAGAFELVRADGRALKASVSADRIPAPVELAGPWELSFPAGWGAPPKVMLDKLVSWTRHADAGVKYFSGTATYRKTFEFKPAAAAGKVYLDLGEVRNLAQVKLNGKELGVLWKPPFALDVTTVLRDGKNELEVQVTNLWPNRLIGDEQLPPDCEWNGMQLKAWPQWLLEGKASPTGRLTFTTWHHWQKIDKPLTSGLLGPVKLRTAVKADLAAGPSR